MTKSQKMRQEISEIIKYSIEKVLPDVAVKEELNNLQLNNVYVVAIGKASWRMAKATADVLGKCIKKGIVITKYGHSEGNIEKFIIYEAGHPLPDENTIKATDEVLKMVSNLSENDTVLFLVSGGGSALFEKPAEGVTLENIMKITDKLMKSGANIYELNTVRKHLSQVKGGRFAEHVAPAKLKVLVLSDVLGDRLDMIASGPAYPDSTTSEDALLILKKYKINIDENIKQVILRETPKSVNNATHTIIGNVEKVCQAAASKAIELGYNPMIFTTTLQGEAREAAKFIMSIAKEVIKNNRPVGVPAALIFGGETTVQVRGNGVGGRNQELALAAALDIAGMKNVVLASVGTDGTDGPTDAAGGIIDGDSVQRMKNSGVNPVKYLENNDSYNALKSSGDLLITGPTGTNVNDIIVVLISD
ncbi:glycerate kinase [Thermosipho ferrireducens]|uniref:Glycerate kinase n=1 Tax=Thermosipho ferrireducens TaxID=2571116 RepID=A0ABX7S9V7_9BACT|nr:glycerate kinase [Thermosipho ferrireducens]QTA38178.1 glycerate kinase [Thermosipho ferrireducens]